MVLLWYERCVGENWGGKWFECVFYYSKRFVGVCEVEFGGFKSTGENVQSGDGTCFQSCPWEAPLGANT